MILGSDEIKEQLEQGQIFHAGTFDFANVKEASYALRVAGDWLIIEGKPYGKGERHPGPFLEIAPGKIAILSTQEEFHMPGDLVGRLGIRLNFAGQGLTGLMRIQVDPYYGSDYPDERLFIRVANLGNDPVKLRPGDPVFNIEFSVVARAQPPQEAKDRTWDRFLAIIKNQQNASWTYVTRVEADAKSEIDKARDVLQPVVMFGVFLVAVTILGVVIALILEVRDVPDVRVPGWVTDWGWILLLGTLSVASLATAAIGLIGALAFWRQRRR